MKVQGDHSLSFNSAPSHILSDSLTQTPESCSGVLGGHSGSGLRFLPYLVLLIISGVLFGAFDVHLAACMVGLDDDLCDSL